MPNENLKTCSHTDSTGYTEVHGGDGQRSNWKVLITHGADFFFHFGCFEHDDRIPRAAVEESPLWPLTEALLTSDAEKRIYLDAAKRGMIDVRYPEHAIFHRAILDTGW